MIVIRISTRGTSVASENGVTRPIDTAFVIPWPGLPAHSSARASRVRNEASLMARRRSSTKRMARRLAVKAR